MPAGNPALPERLGDAALAGLGHRVTLPGYDRSAVTAGVVHVGVGGFHRAHQAVYHDRLLAAGYRDWGICGVGVMPADRRMQQVMAAQDNLYTLVIKHDDGRYEARVIGSIVSYLFAPDDPEAVITAMAAESTRIVSLTITEGGYNLSDLTGEFDLSSPAVQRDLASGWPPVTVFGLVTEALRRRRDRGLLPFTVMSCDNLPGNGPIARRAFATFAAHRDAALAEWIEHEVRFPSSMVDRITPVTTDADRAEVASRFGLEDHWPVVCEPFIQWVLQDSFAAGRPPYQDVGVQVVADVEPHELMKLRMLNAGHQAICYFGYLAGYGFVHEAAGDPLLRQFLLGYLRDEAAPTLPPVPGTDLDNYARSLADRFANPRIGDSLARICAYSSDRIPKWLLPVVRHQLATGGELWRSAAVIASWARYAEGTDEQGQPILSLIHI